MLNPEMIAKLRRVIEMGPEAPRAQERSQLLREVRGAAPDVFDFIDQELVKHIDRINQGLQEARQSLEALRDQHERLTRPPWAVAVFRQIIPGTQQAVVWFNGAPRAVTLVEDVEAKLLSRGDDVFLNSELNLLVARAPWGASPVGETAEFVRILDEHRLILRWREEEIICEMGDSLEVDRLKEGDLVRWNRDTFIAMEKVERNVSRRHKVEQVHDVRETMVGGQRRALATIKAALLTVLKDPEKADLYALERRQTLLLVGPPGCGKTLMARLAAAEIQRITGKKCHFSVIKPSEWENPYVGMTAANIRSTFEALRLAAEEGEYTVLFMDELESAGRIRGHVMGYHGDKHTAALLAEIDGFAARGNVVIISATNRKDLVDSALLERLSDIEIFVPRPDLQAAREIFRVHLGEDLPFSPNGDCAGATRAEMIDVAVSQLYVPNAGNELSTVKFRDGTARTVSAAELMSGRVIEQICRGARQRAFVRDVEFGESGIQVPDMEEAIADVLRRLSTTLTIHNVRSYLPDLPKDKDIVDVQPVTHRVDRAHRMLNQDELISSTSDMGV